MGDILANVLFYIPFGLFAALAASGRKVVGFCLVSLVGAALSTSMELLQFYYDTEPCDQPVGRGVQYDWNRARGLSRAAGRNPSRCRPAIL